MFFIKKKRIKKEIPYDLRLELRELQEKKKNEQPDIRYSLSPSTGTIDRAKAEIKKVVLEPTFKEVLFGFIDKKNLTDPDIYKKAFVDKRTFSKIRTGETKYVSRYTHPNKWRKKVKLLLKRY